MSSLDIPVTFNVTLLPKSPNSHGVLGSKAVGEPPLILSVAAVAAVRKALQAYRAGQDGKDKSAFVDLPAPCTVARVQVAAGVDPNQLTF
mmetsp:Transcript_12562/g.32536  ORF Transcript_12562/g.32536 Transcript_12562/m.32536 type:complete len:90 (+) Transcript_12562:154-423(+)